jgi:hypothetical protein
MRKIKQFDGKRHVYDTDKSTELETRAFGAFGDPAGYEETLYQNKQGFHFVMGKGGDQSPYAEGEDIRPLSEDEASAWQA